MSYPLPLKQHIAVKQKLWLAFTEAIFVLILTCILGYLKTFYFISKAFSQVKNRSPRKPGNV